MFITVVKPHYRLDTEGCFYLVTRRGEFVFAGKLPGRPATRRDAELAACRDEAKESRGEMTQEKRAELEVAIQAIRPKRQRKSIKYKMTRVFGAFNGLWAVGA
jgi:hypothetical protein